jgi:hypothetical protein
VLAPWPANSRLRLSPIETFVALARVASAKFVDRRVLGLPADARFSAARREFRKTV